MYGPDGVCSCHLGLFTLYSLYSLYSLSRLNRHYIGTLFGYIIYRDYIKTMLALYRHFFDNLLTHLIRAEAPIAGKFMADYYKIIEHFYKIFLGSGGVCDFSSQDISPHKTFSHHSDHNRKHKPNPILILTLT